MAVDINRKLAYRILLDMEKEKSFSNLTIKKYLAECFDDSISPNLVRRLVYGVTEKEIYLDYYLDKLMKKGIEGTKGNVLTILRLGAYQLEFMDSVPDYAAINSSVELANKHVKGMGPLVNGVLRSWQRNKKDINLPDKENNLEEYLSIKYSVHSDIIGLIRDQRGDEELEKILSAFSGEKETSLRINLLKTDYESVEKELKELGYLVKRGSLSERTILVNTKDGDITDLELYKSGKVSIQSEESCWIADICNPKPGESVLDVCAAPGGKTLAMAEAMENEGEIIACDLYPHRLSLIEGGINRLGIDIIKTRKLDAGKAFIIDCKSADGFDLVLVDAPCSGLGVIRRKPEIRLRPPEVDELVDLQKKILKNASDNVKPGGRLVYSTCTFDRRENQEVVSWFLDNSKDFHIEFERELIPDESGRDGFYIANMIRK